MEFTIYCEGNMWVIERWSNKEEGLVDNSVVIVGEGRYKGVNGNGKNTIKK